MENSAPIAEAAEELPTDTSTPEETSQIPETENSLEIAQTEPLPLETIETPEASPENPPETVEVVSPFLDEPLITTTETTTPDDSAIEQIIENAEAPEEIVELPESTNEVDTTVEIPEEKIEDDTDLI
jgi:predicted RND superfamily exporter protein